MSRAFLARLGASLLAIIVSVAAAMAADREDDRPESAIGWAQAQLGITGHVAAGELRPWSGWCAKFVANAYGTPAAGVSSATELYRNLSKNVKNEVPDDSDPRTKGSLVFWSWTDPTSKENLGHVGIYIGSGKVIHSGGSVEVVYLGPKRKWVKTHRYKPICLDKFADVPKTIGGGAKYFGYVAAPANWPGPVLRLGPLLLLEKGACAFTFAYTTVGSSEEKSLTLSNVGSRTVNVWPRLASRVAPIWNPKTGEFEPKDKRLASGIGPFTLILPKGEKFKLAPGA